jgi:5-methylcytosine-specific restriction endonuclease McrA
MPAPPKRGKVVLKGDAYRAVVNQCYQRDKWKCRKCESRTNLTPHHLIKRSDLRLDTLENLCTLCIRCHHDVEASKFYILGNDANGLLRFRTPDANHRPTTDRSELEVAGGEGARSERPL